MKTFTAPELEVIRFIAMDIIASSSGDNELPILPLTSGDALPIVEID